MTQLTLEPGDLIANRYRIDRVLSRGGMGIVYLTQDQHLDSRPVVVKLLLDSVQDAWQQRKFREERAALARVDHPNVVKPLDYGELEDGRHFLVMEFVAGETLKSVMRGLQVQRLGEVFYRIGDAVTAVHEKGVLHRDLKPQNIIIQELSNGELRVVILDFGIASLRVAHDVPGPDTRVVGTLAYMAPEQFMGPPQEASDIFAIGVIAYESLTGQVPFPGRNPVEVYHQQKAGLRDSALPHAMLPSVPVEVDSVIRQALAFDKRQRHRSARELGVRLSRALDPDMRRRDGPGKEPGASLDSPFDKPSPLALINAAFEALRDRSETRAHALLDQAAVLPGVDSALLQGGLSECRGISYYHQGNDELALHELSQAFSKLKEVSLERAARVLDLIGMVYATKNNFHAARELHSRALELSAECKDTAGVATSHGQLGRLYLAWGYVDEAEEHFRKDLDLSQLGDPRSVALMNNYLGQVCMARGGWQDAARHLEIAIDQSLNGGWVVQEGYARKDLALTYLQSDEVEAAQAQLDQSAALFQRAAFAEGAAHVACVQGRICTRRQQWDEGERQLAKAIDGFKKLNEPADVARARLELGRLRRARGAPDVVQTLIEALAVAESTRREGLVREIEAELMSVSVTHLMRRELQRARGPAVREGETFSLQQGVSEAASVIFLDLEGSTEFAKRTDAQELMSTLNQLMAELGEHLDRYGASVTAYLGDGFMALVRGKQHALRAVDAAVDMSAAVRDFNAPRELLGLRPLSVRVGVNTGEVFIGNVGTYRKMDFTAVGATVNLAARLQAEANPGIPAISNHTQESIVEQFEFAQGSPRTVSLKGLGEQQVWDVTGPRAGRMRRRKTEPQ